MGLIMMLVIGPALGNYATSVVYRLPKGETPFEKNPYCGDCGTMLQPKDLTPLWSYIFSRGRCNYCGVRIRPMYFLIELACLVFCVTHFLLFGITEPFLLVTAIAIFWLILAAIEWHEGFVATQVVVYSSALLAIWRVMADVSIYPMVQSTVVALVGAMVVWKLFHKANPKLPHYVWAAALLGVALPIPQLAEAFIAYGAIYYLLKCVWNNPNLHITAAGLAWWVIMVADTLAITRL